MIPYYLPGQKAGGSIWTACNLVNALGDEFDFRIVSSDHDGPDDLTPYQGIQPNVWTQVGKAQVMYLSRERRNIRAIFRLLKSEKADFLYLNSFFSRPFSMMPMIARSAGARAQTKVVVAPRGEFSPGALNAKKWRKRVYIEVAKRLPIYREVLWQTSTPFEAQDVRAVFGSGASVSTAMDLPSPESVSGLAVSRTAKESGSLRIAFLSRIEPKKNLVGALRLLDGVSGDVEFNIYGPTQDESYWRQCQTEISRLPPNIRVNYKSVVKHSEVAAIFSSHHLFLFPTLGENFGHVIYEALSAGCPSLLSDQTPWRGIEAAGAGWDIPLDQPQTFRAALERCVAWSHSDFEAASAKAREFARNFMARQNPLGDYRAIFADSKTVARNAPV
jgi:glycosyltransferase involved in cell wall biosynthesis